MKLVKPQWEIWEQEPGIQGIYKAIERAGRICYRSENKITEDSAKPFVDRMVKSGHGAMLEHGTVYLAIPFEYIDISAKLEIPIVSDVVEKYKGSPYAKWHLRDDGFSQLAFITTNYRVLVENGWLDDLRYLCEPTEYHERRATVHFVLPIGISREFCRHRVMSFAEQSTRYCNFSSDKFNNELTFIEDTWCDEELLRQVEYWYINSYLKPQEKRNMLPLCTKTELVMTGFVDDWWGEYLVIDKSTGLIDKVINGRNYKEVNNIDKEKYRVVEKGFFPLRCSSGAHPQAQELAIPLREEFVKRELIK